VPDRVTIDVGVCTFRRASLEGTLASIAAQVSDRVARLRVIVADNDDEPVVQGQIRAVAQRLGLELDYRHAPARNISIGRNACLQACSADWLLFIDDDETAEPGWLDAMAREAQTGSFDAVLGPVRAVYSDAAPAWLKQGDFHSTRPVMLKDGIKTGYSGNTLIRKAFARQHRLAFDLRFGRTGGEDLDFFYHLHDAGGRIGYAEDAVCCEPVPDNRASLAWLLKRTFRAGQSHGSRLASVKPAVLARARQALIAAGKALICASGALVSLPRPAARNRYITRGALHLGVVARLAGRREIQFY
jgi:succinoglycan biosynthesis protein ExoM